MRHTLLAIAFTMLFFSQALAQNKPVTLPPEVKAAENYLNRITTLKARFVQTAPNGHKVGGTFLLKRPGRMRFDYAPPITDFIVADKVFVYYYDGQMKQQSSVPIGKSLADFFLRADVKLSGDIRLTSLKRSNLYLYMTLVQAEDPQAGSLTLIFKENPLLLKKWRVVDAQGLTTEVELFDAEFGISLDNSLFHYYDPDRKKQQYNAN